MKLENYSKIVNGIKQIHLDNDSDVKIVSAYGGMTCGYCKVSEILDLIEDEERCVNVDYYLYICDLDEKYFNWIY